MKTWELYSLILKIVILTVGYTGILANTDSNQAALQKVLMHQELDKKEQYKLELLLSSSYTGTVNEYIKTPESEKGAEDFEEKVGETIKDQEMIDVGLEEQDSPCESMGPETTPHVVAEPTPVHESESQGCHTDPTFIREVKEIVDNALKKYPLKHSIGLYVQELETGNEYGINEALTCYDATDGSTDGYFRAASVVKLQVAYVVYRLVERQELDTEETFFDAITHKKFQLLPTLHTMVSRSDNNLLNTMLRLVGREKVNETLFEFGIKNSPVYGEINPAIGWSGENNLKRHGTVKVGGKITPKDMGIILESIYREKDNNQYMELFNQALVDNIYDSRIPRGIGRKYPVAHKTGTAGDFGVYNDAGIIYCKNPFILVVLTKGETPGSGEGIIRELAKKLTDYMDARGNTGSSS